MDFISFLFLCLVLFIYICSDNTKFCSFCIVIKLFKSCCAGSSNQKGSFKQVHIENYETILVGEASL